MFNNVCRRVGHLWKESMQQITAWGWNFLDASNNSVTVVRSLCPPLIKPLVLLLTPHLAVLLLTSVSSFCWNFSKQAYRRGLLCHLRFSVRNNSKQHLVFKLVVENCSVNQPFFLPLPCYLNHMPQILSWHRFHGYEETLQHCIPASVKLFNNGHTDIPPYQYTVAQRLCLSLWHNHWM